MGIRPGPTKGSSTPGDASQPRVSAIIPNLNGGDMLLESLRSVLDQGETAIECIVVDNGSDDGSPAAAARLHSSVRVMRYDTNLGFAEACNRGASAARGHYLLFLNNDARLPDGSLRRLLDVADGDPEGAVWQPLIAGDADANKVESAGDLFTWSGFLWHVRRPISKFPYPVFAAIGACLLVRHDAFDELGGFIGSYFAYFEETDLCWRLRLAGYEVRVVPDVTVRHESGTTTRRILRPHEIYFLAYRNRIRSILANSSVASLLRVVPEHLMGCLCTAAGFLSAGRVRPALAVLKALIWPLGNVRAVRRQRNASQHHRKVSDRNLFRADLVTRLTPRRAGELFLGNLKRW